jgi:hypothetical protein
VLALVTASAHAVAQPLATAVPATAAGWDALSRDWEARGDLAGAQDAALSALRHGETYNACLRLGWLAHRRGDAARSLAYYRRALDLAPGSLDAWLGVVQALSALQRWDQAGAETEALLQEYPEHWGALRSLALVRYGQGRFPEAEALYAQALERTPGDPLMELGLGLSLVRQGRVKEGQGRCRAAAAQLGDDARVAACLSPPAAGWGVRPQVYGSAGLYTNAWDAGEFAGTQAVVEATSPSGIGFQVDAAASWFRLRYQAHDAVLGGAGAGAFYVSDRTLLWLHGGFLGSTNSMVTGGALASVHGRRDIRGVRLGLGVDTGWYPSFLTLQVAPQVGLVANRLLHVWVAPMVQADNRSQSAGRRRAWALRVPRARGSLEVGCDLRLPGVTAGARAWAGRRWYTVEGQGLHAWSLDDDLRAGLRSQVSLLPDQPVSLMVHWRADYGDRQAGREHRYLVLAAGAALVANL